MTLDEAIQKLNWSRDFIPKGESNRPGTPLRASHITVHNTDNAAAGADALAHARYLKGPDARAREVSWHYTADDGRVVQHLPDDEVGWHAGSGNSKSLAVEICQHAGIDQSAANARAALLVAVLMKVHGLRLESVVPHKFWTGKHCPRLLLDSAGGFESFRAAISERFDQIQSSGPIGTESFNATGPEFNLAGPESGLSARVLVLEELLGRVMADAEILRRQLQAVRNDIREAD